MKYYRLRTGQPGFTFYDTELLQLDVAGGGLPQGMRLRESPTKASMGRTAISPRPGGGFIVDTFFDIWTEISLDDGQTWWPSAVPARMRFTGPSSSDNLPPRGGEYASLADWQGFYGQDISIMEASSLGFTESFPPPSDGASDTHTFGSTISLLVRTCSTCPYVQVSAPAQLMVQVDSRAGASAEAN
jgi:hypothetical protein